MQAAFFKAKHLFLFAVFALLVDVYKRQLLEIGHQSGLNDKMARGLGKILGPLFPGVRRDKEAMGAICMNIAANTLGMGSAATPFGLKAMERMKKIQNAKSATYDMIMFLVLNTSSLLLIPTSIIALRTAWRHRPFFGDAPHHPG